MPARWARATTWMLRIESPPSSKKLSSTPTRSHPQHRRPDPRQLAARRACAARRPSFPAPAERAPGRAERARSTLPFGVSGSAVEQHEGRRDHVVGQLLLREDARSALGAAPRLRARRRRRRRPAACRPGASSRATTTASRTAGCGRSTASISPSSMRKPRIFTWWSMRPRNSMLPSGSQRARSPVRYRRAPRLAR